MEDKQNKIGIISLYYNNKNYGGQLQAYALTEYISSLGYDAEQVCWKAVTHKKRRKKQFKKIFHYISLAYQQQFRRVLEVILKEKLHLRRQAFEQFQNNIKHTEKVFIGDEFLKDIKSYKAIVIGSDQVWNIGWYGTRYFLDFIPKEKYKFSYAASMPDTNISKAQKKAVREALNDFNAISVREKKTVEFLTELSGREVNHVVDPTLLLDINEWNQISDKEIIKEKYIFCYFLGKDKQYIKEAKVFAKKMNLKIVTLPFINRIIKEDIFFGNYRLYDVSPGDFVSLIKNAEYVLTDSFHAVVFSNIYKVKYFVFNRTGLEMSERIITLLDMFETSERFIEADAEIMYGMKDMPILINEQKFEEKKKESLEFLKTNLEKA